MSVIADNTHTDDRQYELMVIIDSDIGENAINDSKDKLRQRIKKIKGAILHEDDWGLKNLAYKIKKRERGHYIIFEFTAEPSYISEIDRFLRLETEILRHMLITRPLHYKPEDYSKIEEEQVSHEKEKIEKKEEPKVAQNMKKVAEEEGPKVAPDKKVSKKESKEDLKDIDDKLSKILSNPDINL